MGENRPCALAAAFYGFAAVAALIAGTWAVDGRGYRGLLLAPLFGFVILGIACSTDGPVPWLLARPRVVFWGDASYSL